MKKKTFTWIKSLTRALFSVALLALASGALMSCSGGDDDDGDDSDNNDEEFEVLPPAPPEKPTPSKELYMVGQYERYIQLHGIMVKHSVEDKERIIIDYNKGKLFTGKEQAPADVVFDENGCITKVSALWDNKKDDVDYDKGSRLINISYDKDSHIKSVRSVEVLNYSEYGKPHSEKREEDIAYTWAGGNLMKVVTQCTYTEDDYVGNYCLEATISYSNAKNALGHFTLTTAEACGFTIVCSDALAILGLYGKGTANLPTGVSIVYVENNKESPYKNWNTSYSLKQDGRIAIESYDNGHANVNINYVYYDDLDE